jgi:hypothetical protein
VVSIRIRITTAAIAISIFVAGTLAQAAEATPADPAPGSTAPAEASAEPSAAAPAEAVAEPAAAPAEPQAAPAAQQPAASPEQAAPASDPVPRQPAKSQMRLLPNTAKGYLSATDFPLLRQQWEKTQVGQLMDDPAMEPFVEDMKREIQDRWFNLQERFGLTIDDVQDVPAGEVTAAMFLLGPNQPAALFLADVQGHLSEARALVEKATNNLIQKEKAVRSQVAVGQTPVTLLTLPPGERRKQQRRVYYFLLEQEALLGAADNLGIVQEVLARVGGKTGPTLADVPAFQAVMARVGKDVAEGYIPQVRWFIEPLGLVEAVRAEVPPEERSRKSPVDMLRRQGFDAVVGAGGVVDLGIGDAEFIHRTVVHAPQPRKNAMNMFEFLNRDQFAPEAFVPRDIASYSTGYINLLSAFDNFGPLFDEFVGEGETGVWADVLYGLEEDPNGPQMDLRGELFTYLGNRVSIVGDYHEPIGPDSSRMLIAVETKEEAQVRAAMDKMFEGDPIMRRKKFEEHIIWETIPAEEVEEETPQIVLAAPALGLGGVEEEGAWTNEEPLFPNASITVYDGHLLIASHYDYLVEILTKREDRESLARDVEYRIVQDALKTAGAGSNFGQTFTRSAERFRVPYELFRQGKFADTESMLTRMLNSVFGEDEEGERFGELKEIDRSKMPDYDVVRRYLGTSGGFGTASEDGWFIKGVGLGR